MNPTAPDIHHSHAPATDSDAHHEGALSSWIARISRIPLLTPAEEKSLALRYRAGDDEAFKRLILANLRLVVRVASRYVHPNVPLQDLIQEGNIGLMRAAERFDPDKGYRFSTYAVWWIRRSILRTLTYDSRLIRLPENVLSQCSRMEQATLRLRQELGREPDAQELADMLGMSLDQVTFLAALGWETVSLESDSAEEGRPYQEVIEDASQQPRLWWERWSRTEDVERVLKTLTPREQAILRARYGLDTGKPLTLKETGALFHLTRERIRQIEQRAIAHLKDAAQSARIIPAAFGSNPAGNFVPAS